VVGSTNERTVEQLAAIPDDRVVELDCEAAVRAPREAGEEAGGRAAERFASTTRVVVSSVGSWTPDRLYEMGAEQVGIDRDAVERRIATALTTATETCWREAGPDGLFATGGTVARSVLDALGVETIELTGRAVEEGIPVARFESGGDTKGLVTKAGGFGGLDAIRRCLDALGTL
ncbi:four-carbon acid sugar kinase family protein, partial [Halobacteriales archaeon QH_7_66_37]